MARDELLIVGNGFDMQCGMKTHYHDFMKTQNTENPDNLWVFVFAEMFPENWIFGGPGGLKWYDIEGAIQKIVTEWHADIVLYLYYLKILDEYDSPYFEQLFDIPQQDQYLFREKYQDYFGAFYAANLTQRNIRNIAQYLHDSKTDEADNLIASAHVTYEMSGESSLEDIRVKILEKGNSEFDELLMNELNEFEIMFSKYLSELKPDDQEGKKRLHLMSTITNYFQSTDDIFTSVLCFNYTDPLPRTNWSEHFRVNNVHGKFDQQNIIFGIDLTEKYKEKPIPNRLVPFTKTFRKMKVNSPVGWQLPKHPSHIRSYGHSLSSADYSYFQSVFDYVNIYDSGTILEFCFSVYGVDKKDKQRVQRQTEYLQNAQAKQVYQLINTYGATLTNKDQGKNLLHKLLVEDRLKIREIPELEF